MDLPRYRFGFLRGSECPENSVLTSWSRLCSSGTESGTESESVARKRSRWGQWLDKVLHNLRYIGALLVSLPVVWMALHPSIASFRNHKIKAVHEGTKTVVRLQKWLRNPLLDIVFGILSFMAEEEAYLIALPFLIWNVDHVLGRRLTIVVCTGLILGNVMKDVFALPRPRSPPVWRSKSVESLDSSNLRDFGFPSTHTMNSISNSLFVFFYLSCVPDSSETGFGSLLNISPRLDWICLVILYSLGISTARLYFGTHTPTDIRGGAALGVGIIALYFPYSSSIDSYIETTDNLFAKVIVGIMTMLILNPQPRPITPSFAQNALCMGLLGGLALGVREFSDRMDAVEPLQHPLVDTISELPPIGKIVLRTLLGYCVVLFLKVAVKKLLVFAAFCLGVSVRPQIQDTTLQDTTLKSKESKKGKTLRGKKVRLVTRDKDILVNGLIKAIVYGVLSWSITFFCPLLHKRLGLLNAVQSS